MNWNHFIWKTLGSVYKHIKITLFKIHCYQFISAMKQFICQYLPNRFKIQFLHFLTSNLRYIDAWSTSLYIYRLLWKPYGRHWFLLRVSLPLSSLPAPSPHYPITLTPLSVLSGSCIRAQALIAHDAVAAEQLNEVAIHKKCKNRCKQNVSK